MHCAVCGRLDILSRDRSCGVAFGVGQWLRRRSFTVNREVGGPAASPSLPPSSALRGLMRSAAHLTTPVLTHHPSVASASAHANTGSRGFGFRNDEGVHVKREFVLKAYFGNRSFPECGKEMELCGDA